MSDGGPVDNSNRRLMGLLAVVAILSFAWALVASVSAPSRETGLGQADAYSRGPLGHRGLYDTLQRLDIPVQVHRGDGDALQGGSGLLILAEPPPTGEGCEAMRQIVSRGGYGNLLLVLPKWQFVPPELGRGGLPTVTQVPLADVDRLLHVLAPDVNVVRPVSRPEVRRIDAEGTSVRVNITLPAPQLVTAAEDGGALGLAAAEGGLFVRVRDHMWVLADPDLLANHGIGRADNGVELLPLVAELRGDGPVVFEESLHGYRSPALWQTLTVPPLLYPVLHIVLLAAIWLWTGVRRFGAPAPDVVQSAGGRRVLIENTAQLVHRGGHTAYMLGRYWQAVVRDTTAQLRLAGEDHPARLRSLSASIRGGAAVEPIHTLEREVQAAQADARPPPLRLALLAGRIHRFRETLTQRGKL